MEKKTIVILEVSQDVPPREAEKKELVLSAFLAHKSPKDARLTLRTEGVNFRTNKVFINGKELGYLNGPGYGKGAQGYDEEFKVSETFLKPGINSIRFVCGEKNAEAGVGIGFDNFSVQDVRLKYQHEVSALSIDLTTLVPLILGFTFLVVFLTKIFKEK